MTVLTAVSLAAAALLLVWVLWLRARLARLERSTAALAERIGAMPVLATTTQGGQPLRISIEILNPVELARKESWFAGAFGSMTPALLRRIVYARTVEIMQTQLLQFDVKADVRLTGDA